MNGESTRKMGPEIEFQTLHTTPKDFEGTIKMGVSLGSRPLSRWEMAEANT